MNAEVAVDVSQPETSDGFAGVAIVGVEWSVANQ
jgi:hypothetical protein